MTNISTQIWDMKYRFKAADGTPIDQDVATSWARVALALAIAEKPESRGGFPVSEPKAQTEERTVVNWLRAQPLSWLRFRPAPWRPP